MDEQKQPSAFEPIFVARQPIFDAGESVYGYELLFRHSGQAWTQRLLSATRG